MLKSNIHPYNYNKTTASYTLTHDVMCKNVHYNMEKAIKILTNECF